MQRGINEQDIAALIEGELSPDRVEAVRAALAEDSELRKQVEEMVRHRRVLRAEPADEQAPAGIVEQALEEAERDAVIAIGSGDADGRAIYRPGAARSRRMMALAAAILLALIGGWAGVMIWLVGPQAQQQQMHAADEQDRPRMHRHSSGVTPSSSSSDDAPQQTVAQDDQPDHPVDLLEEIRQARRESESIGVEPVQIAEADVLAMTPEIEAALPRALLSVRLSMEEALELAKRGSLRIVAVATDDAAIRRDLVILAMTPPDGRIWREIKPAQEAAIEVRHLATPAPGFNGSGSVPQPQPQDTPAAPRAYEVRLVLEDAQTDDGLRTAILALLEDLEKRGMEVLLTARADDCAGEQPAPSLDPDDVLWWERPASEWKTRITLPVLIEPLKVESAD